MGDIRVTKWCNVVFKKQKKTLIINNNESIRMNICNQPINNTNNQPIICNHWHSDGLMANLWDSTDQKSSDFS